MFIKLHRIDDTDGEKFPLIVNADKILSVQEMIPQFIGDKNLTAIIFDSKDHENNEVYVCEDVETVLNLIS